MQIKQGYFITGTNTDAGKTYVTCRLLEKYAEQGLKTLGLKPIASGCIDKEGQLFSEDALLHQQASSVQLPYNQINPIALPEFIAPHIAAEKQGMYLDVQSTIEKCQPALHADADIILIEGAGGWLVPLNKTQTMADLALEFGYPVILVVGLTLGCINHALITAQAIRASGLKLAGWIANCVDPEMEVVAENIKIIEEQIDSAMLAKFARENSHKIKPHEFT